MNPTAADFTSKADSSPRARAGPSGLLEVVGLIPAAGEAKRLPMLPCSKEIYPLGLREGEEEIRPVAACDWLLEGMQRAGVRKAYIILREGKWDIPAYLRDGQLLGMHLAYLVMRLPYGPPSTLDQAYPFLGGALGIGFAVFRG